MINPILVSFKLFGMELSIHWYGVIIAIAVMIGAWITEREITRRGGNPNFIWDLIIYVVPVGIIGARLWYVLNDMAGGSQYFINDPGAVFRVWEGGLHIYGAITFGVIVAWWYAKRENFSFWMLLDSLAPALLIAQAFGRIANFINQELYGPPTTLPWGVKIAAENRMYPWTDLEAFPVDTTFFHPTFFYESLWNIVMAVLILWLVRKFADKMKPGAAFYMWLIAAGVGRAWLEFFRPDQPLIPGTALSYSRLVAILMALAGIVMLLARFGKIKLGFISPGPDAYSKPDKKWKKDKK
ncbi:prolipoprotein diacylglyceryl transferase [bacterium]|nr:prolipoprotein diacylglyceryl transferase [bacterium]